MTVDMQATGAPTISERLADHVVGLRYEDIPAPVVAKAKQQFAYLLASALRGRERESSQEAVRLAQDLSGGDGACSIVGDRAQANLLDAVFANSFLIICSGLDDFVMPHGLHPGVVILPAAWAFGETTKASGRDLLTAIVVGYDTLGRLCDPSVTWGLDVYRPATFVIEPFGAAATSARVLGLSHEQTVHALGHAGQVGRNIAETGDHVWAMHPLLARNGAMAAVLANAGLAASPTVVEGPHGVFRTFFGREVTDFVTAGLATLGREFTITDAQARRHSGVSAHNVLAVELTQRLVDEHGLNAARVAAVEVALPESRRTREVQRDAAALGAHTACTERQASLRFRLATIIADGRMDPARLEQAPDADFLAVLDKIRLRFEPNRPLLYTRVEITTTDGTHDTAESDTLDTLAGIDWIEGLAEAGQGILSEDELTRLPDLIRHLEDVADVSEVMACAVPGGRLPGVSAAWR